MVDAASSDRDWSIDSALERLNQLYLGNEAPASAETKAFQKSLDSYVNRRCFVTGRDPSNKISEYWTYQQVLTIAQYIHEYGSKNVQTHLIPTMATVFACPAAQRLFEIFVPCAADAAITESSSLQDIVTIIPNLLIPRFDAGPPKAKRPRLGFHLDTSWSCILQWWLLSVQCVLEAVDHQRGEGEVVSLSWSRVCSNSIKMACLGHSGLTIPHLSSSRDSGLALLGLHLTMQTRGPLIESPNIKVRIQGLTPPVLLCGKTEWTPEGEPRANGGTLAESIGSIVHSSGLPSYNCIMFLVETLNTIAQSHSQEIYGETCEALQRLLELRQISTLKPVLALSNAKKDGLVSRKYDDPETSLRSRVATFGYPMVVHVKHMLSRGDIGAATHNVRDMDKSDYISQHERAEIWTNFLGYLRSTGQVFIDGNYRWLDEDKRKRELLMGMNGAMGSRTSRLVLQEFYANLVKKAQTHSHATVDEKVYVTHAAKRTLLGLMTHDFDDDEKVQEFLTLFPDMQGTASTPEQRAQWKKDYFDREVVPPESLEKGVVRGRVNLALWDERAEAERLRLVEEQRYREEAERREAERLRREEEERILREAEEKRLRQEAERRRLEVEQRREVEAERQRLIAEEARREEELRLAAERRLESLRLQAEEEAWTAEVDVGEEGFQSPHDEDEPAREVALEDADETEEHAADADVANQGERDDEESSVVEILSSSSEDGGVAGEPADDGEGEELEDGEPVDVEPEEPDKIEILDTSEEEPEPTHQLEERAEEDEAIEEEEFGDSAEEVAVRALLNASAAIAAAAAASVKDSRDGPTESVGEESLKNAAQEAKVETGYEPEAGSHTEDDGVSEEFHTEDEEEAQPPIAPKQEEMPPPQMQRVEHSMSDDMSAADERTESSGVDEGGAGAAVAIPTSGDTAEVAPPLLQYAISAQSQRDTGEELATDVSRTEERPESIVNRVPKITSGQAGEGTSAATAGMSEISGQYTTDEELGPSKETKVEREPPQPDYTADIDTEPEQSDTKIPAETETPRARRYSDATEDFPTPVEGTTTENVASANRMQSEDDGSEARHVSFADNLGDDNTKVHLDMDDAVEEMKRQPPSREPSTLAVKGDGASDSSLEDDKMVDKVPVGAARAPGFDRFKSTDAVADEDETHASLNDTNQMGSAAAAAGAAVPPMGNDSVPTHFVDKVPLASGSDYPQRPSFDRMKSTDAICGDDSSPMSIDDAVSDQDDEVAAPPEGNDSVPTKLVDNVPPGAADLTQHGTMSTNAMSVEDMETEPTETEPMEVEPMETEPTEAEAMEVEQTKDSVIANKGGVVNDSFDAEAKMASAEGVVKDPETTAGKTTGSYDGKKPPDEVKTSVGERVASNYAQQQEDVVGDGAEAEGSDSGEGNSESRDRQPTDDEGYVEGGEVSGSLSRDSEAEDLDGNEEEAVNTVSGAAAVAFAAPSADDRSNDEEAHEGAQREFGVSGEIDDVGGMDSGQAESGTDSLVAREESEVVADTPAHRSSWDEDEVEVVDSAIGGAARDPAGIRTPPRRSPRRTGSPERDQNFIWPLQVHVHRSHDQGGEETSIPNPRQQPEDETSLPESPQRIGGETPADERSRASSSRQSGDVSVDPQSSRRSARLAARRAGTSGGSRPTRSGRNSQTSSVLSTSSRRSARVSARLAAREATTSGTGLDPIPEEDANRSSSLDTTTTTRATDNQKQRVVLENMEFLEERPEEESSDEDSKPRTRGTRSSGRPRTPPRHRLVAPPTPTRVQPKRGKKNDSDGEASSRQEERERPARRGAGKAKADADEQHRAAKKPPRLTRSRKRTAGDDDVTEVSNAGIESETNDDDDATEKVATPTKKRGGRKSTRLKKPEPDSKPPARPKRSTRSSQKKAEGEDGETDAVKAPPRKTRSSQKKAEGEDGGTDAVKAPPRKKRGRPRKTKTSDDESVPKAASTASKRLTRARLREEPKEENEGEQPRKGVRRAKKPNPTEEAKIEAVAPRRSTRRRRPPGKLSDGEESTMNVSSARPRRTRATRSTRSSGDDESENHESRKSIGDSGSETPNRRKSGGSMASRTRSNDHKSRSGKTYF